MQHWIINIFCGFFISALLAGIIIPQILLIAFRKKLFDEPDERKIHHIPVPRLGGLAFTPVIFFTMAFLLGVNQYLGNAALLIEFARNVNVLAMVLCSMTLLYLAGIADDLVGIRYRAKFIIQIICGIFLTGSGIWVRSFYGFMGLYGLNIWYGGILAIILVVFITNAINLIDGIDGLASGLSAVACLYYGIVFFKLHQYTFALIAFVTLGVIVPFFIYNVFGKAENQKKIFMGDTGALTIGIILSLLSIKLTTIPVCGITWTYNPLVVAFAPLMIPCLDVLRVFFHRIRNGRDPFMPDKNHIHHKLLGIGLNPRLTMIIIVAVSLLLSLLNLYASQYINIHILLLLNFAIYGAINIYLTHRIKHHSQK
jgi:UDP-N-acetylmuramyl pentapeptide phosphotransferase/UDP-N-acetylglucosamine-1-phosphate transferase